MFFTSDCLKSIIIDILNAFFSADVTENFNINLICDI